MNITTLLQTNQDIEASILLSHVLGQPKEFLYMHPEHELSQKELSQFEKLCKQRRDGLPVAYVTGSQPFMDLHFTVNRHTLIPRPETEWLVTKALNLTRKIKAPKILDVGTGSGVIAVTLAVKLNNNPSITAVDISPAALKVAKQNAADHNVTIQLKQSNLLQNVQGNFDLIIANLPYVPISDYKLFKNNLRYEPKQALTDNTDTGKIFKVFLPQALTKLNKKGKLLMEIDPTNKDLLQELVDQHHGFKISFYKDYNKLWRYAIVTS